MKDHDHYRQLVYLEPDGLLKVTELSELRRHLEGCHKCAQLRDQLVLMGQLLETSRIDADPDLRRRVLASLPPAAWEGRRPASWKVAGLLLALVGGAAIAVAALGGGLSGASPLAATALAVLDMLRSTALTGAGLLAASWQGLGMAFQGAFDASPLGLAVFAVLVVGLDIAFLRFLLKSSRAHAEARSAGRDVDGRD